MWFVLISFVAYPAYSFEWDQNTCPAVSAGHSIDEIKDLTFDSMKKIEVDAVHANVSDFCRRNLMTRFLNSKNVPVALRLNKSTSELEQVVDDSIKTLKAYGNEWQDALFSTKASRLDAFSVAIQEKTSFTGAKFDNPDGVRYLDSRIVASDITSKMNLVETAACARESLLKTFSCKKALDEIRLLSTPGGLSNLMTPDAWKAIYKTSTYNKGLHLASEALETLVKQNAQKLTKKDNVFDVIQKSFQDSGLTPEVSEEATWNVLAAISNGGPNTITRAREISYGQKAVDLHIIANAMGALDYLKQANGWPLFSYPNTVKTSCDSAKPYHFWMSAYLGRKLAKDLNLSPSDAANYVMLAQKGYQTNREMINGGKNGSNSAIFKRDDFDPVHEVIRMDLAYTAAGATFGADSARSKIRTYDVDGAIVELEKNAGKKASVNTEGDPLTKMKAFEYVFRPDVALKFIESDR